MKKYLIIIVSLSLFSCNNVVMDKREFNRSYLHHFFDRHDELESKYYEFEKAGKIDSCLFYLGRMVETTTTTNYFYNKTWGE